MRNKYIYLLEPKYCTSHKLPAVRVIFYKKIFAFNFKIQVKIKVDIFFFNKCNHKIYLLNVVSFGIWCECVVKSYELKIFCQNFLSQSAIREAISKCKVIILNRNSLKSVSSCTSRSIS